MGINVQNLISFALFVLFVYFFFGFILFRPPEGSWEEVVVAACQMPNKLDLVVKAVVRFQ